MKIEFSTSEVLPKMRRVASVVSPKNSIQILSDICITIKGQSMMMTASDSALWLTERASLINVDSDTTFCVLASDFLGAMNNLGDVNVIMELDEEKKMLTCKYGKGKFTMPYESAEDYPRPVVPTENAAELVVPSGDVITAIRLCKVATANDILRPQLSGINFEFSNGRIICTSTDVHALTRFFGNVKEQNRDHVSFILSQKVASVINSVLREGDVKITITDSKVVMVGVDYKLTVSLVEGNYPNCDKLLILSNKIHGTIDKVSLVQGLTRVLTMGNPKSPLIKMRVNNEGINISAEDYEFSKSATETIECNFENPLSEELVIGFKGTQLIELLKCFEDNTIAFEMDSSKKPLILYGTEFMSKEDYISMLMPVVL